MAGDFNARVVSHATNELRLVLPVPLVDGRTLTFSITATASANVVSAKETLVNLLPGFCPERHINRDGTFCMNWHAADPLDVVGRESASHWCATLIQFLRLQVRAGRKRRWPNATQWAHGDAAVYQYRAQRAAEALGGEFLSDLKGGHVSVVAKKIDSRRVLRLIRREAWICSVRVESKTVTNLRSRCICNKGKGPRPLVIRSCSDHASAAVALATAIYQQERAEQAFWESFKESQCCGTMEDCPLSV